MHIFNVQIKTLCTKTNAMQEVLECSTIRHCRHETRCKYDNSGSQQSYTRSHAADDRSCHRYIDTNTALKLAADEYIPFQEAIKRASKKSTSNAGSPSLVVATAAAGFSITSARPQVDEAVVKATAAICYYRN